ncbi:M23 family metallopeptidase [Paeniglutamicibacter antarcticus]|uniref:M23 family metallopeptidase n=1 Tax=Arthrobacter terrae TaxID=2935737 RepID=A0A931G4R0_9MICC|nr:peptidoglycan DD-metalloendopeptidase family protein [Arthrobacter terrae]MBG0738685.1 M23 family metallopeptidase [Arthrobacter terrae]
MKPHQLVRTCKTETTRKHRHKGRAAAISVAVAVSLALLGSTAAQADDGPSPDQPITAASVTLQFTHTLVTTRPAPTPDEKLIQMMSSTGGTPGPTSTKGTLSAPLTVLTPTSPFGSRSSPIPGAEEFHRGQDFSAPCGTDVFAATGGTVVFAGWHPYGGGNRVEIQHADGLKTTYNHLDSFDVTLGQQLRRGDVIAHVGTTGASTGCHLHFEVDLNGDVVDPLGWL